MPLIDVELSDSDLALLGTENPKEVEEILQMLTDVGLGEIAISAMHPPVPSPAANTAPRD